MDHDGDTDIVANCEEYGTHDGPPVALAMVWFENPAYQVKKPGKQ